MDTRLLYVIALIIASFSGLLYFYSGKSAHLNDKAQQNMSYTATKVNGIKTNETGALESKVSAESLQYWIEDKRSELKGLNSTWYKQGLPFATFKADQAIGYNNNEKIVLTGNIIGQKLPSSNQPLITFNTTILTGYPNTHVIETDRPVLIQSAQGQFNSQGLQANLDTGVYHLMRVRGQYKPTHGS